MIDAPAIATPAAEGPRGKAFGYRQDAAVPAFPDDKPIIVFDGLCGFCSRWVRFVLKHDHAARYRFVAGQSPLGRALYIHYGLDPFDFESNILIENGRAYFESDGTIRMFAGLGFPWLLARGLRILPSSLLDRAYRLVARNRLRLWGVNEVCFIPAPAFEERFLS